jgi:hypothetical protein
MQIGSVAPDYSSSVTAEQAIAPPIQPQPTSVQHKDKDGDDTGTTTTTNNATDATSNGRRVNVVA